MNVILRTRISAEGQEKAMKKEKYITRAEECMFHVYNRFPVVFDHGEGVYLYDTDFFVPFSV